MGRHLIDRSISALFDGEGEPDLEAQRQDPRVQEQLRVLSRLKDALAVPEDFGRPDPGFVVRFRRGRDELVEGGAGTAAPWRWWTLRLMPLAATMLIAAAALIFSWSAPRDAFQELETRALEDGVPGVTLETTLDEPVLRITLAEF